MSSPIRNHSDNPLATPIQYVKGVGPALALKLQRLRIFSVEDIFFHLPLRYEDRRKISTIAELRDGESGVVVGEIDSSGPIFMRGRGKSVYQVILRDATGKLVGKWFRYNTLYMRRGFPAGAKLLMAGEVRQFRGLKQILHPDCEILENEETPPIGQILPIYPLTEGIHQKTLRKIIKNGWDHFSPFLKPVFSREFLERHDLADLRESLQQLHFPSGTVSIEGLNQRRTRAHRTLIFDEFFFLELGLALKKNRVTRETGITFSIDAEVERKFLSSLPFSLTLDQQTVLKEITTDMRAPFPMNRLLQGDVGSGKTVVALSAAVQAIHNGYQAVFMAPTEILAEQHFQTAQKFLEPLHIRCGLLTSKLTGKTKEWVLRRCFDGEFQMIVGTHALIQGKVEFHKLGLAIIDEQHRFGVLQRQALTRKSLRPDVLVMTATPIPRTLSMTVYGDLDVSVLREMPRGRKAILTRLYGDRQRRQLYDGMATELERGHQIFVVYPLIEESEKLDLKNATEMSLELKRIFEPKFRVALLHGQMKPEEKEETMRQFKAGEISILSATSVVEVGVDCPNATVMVIEHAERFGLSQLHQLRGRVGRSDKQSFCVLMADYRRSTEARQRLKIMVESTDGFRIAEEDLAIRGPGDFLGTQQSGLLPFRVANLARDIDILSKARNAAFELVATDPQLENPAHRNFKKLLETRWKGRLELAEVC